MDFNQAGTPKIGTVIRGQSPATSMSYHEDGSHLYVSSEGDSRLRVIDCQRGASDRPALKFERDGVRLVEATHHNQCVLTTSPKTPKTQGPPTERHSIHYLSLHDNKILRHFRGHSDHVTNLSLSPVDDTFLSSSTDRTVRLWNLGTAGAVGEMVLPSKGGSGNGEYVLDPEGGVMASYDSTGLVFGISSPLAGGVGNLIHLYDARNYGNGAFADYKVEQTSILTAIQQQQRRRRRTIPSNTIATELSFARWTSMKFNTSGKKLLVTTDKGMALVLDGYDGSVTDVLLSEETGSMVKEEEGEGGGAVAGVAMTKCPAGPMAACFTRDDRSVLCGNEDGTVGCWSLDGGGSGDGSSTLVQTLKGHVGRVGCIATNPKYAQIATACTNTAVWLW